MHVVLLSKNGTQIVSPSFGEGEHVLGRGLTLKCTSKKVSRSHAVLKVAKDEGVFLRSIHNNPCFYKLQESENISMLTYGNTIQINNNNEIALSLDHGWFIVKVNELEAPATSNNEIDCNTSANNDVTIEENTLTNIKLEEPVTSNNEATNVSNCKRAVEENEEKSPKKMKLEEPETSDNEADCKKTDQPSASTSGTNKRAWRDRCWYGSSCYRKTTQHRAELKHPGDSDYDSDSGDTRPVCCYGKDCYRKNKEHRQRYRHPGQLKLGTRPPPAPRRRRVRPPPNQMSQDSEELDDYDYSDPFLNDDSEDDYDPSQNTDTESEYEDSQEAEEDHKRLLKEARKFTRNQK